jgi:hypothetical protein
MKRRRFVLLGRQFSPWWTLHTAETTVQFYGASFSAVALVSFILLKLNLHNSGARDAPPTGASCCFLGANSPNYSGSAHSQSFHIFGAIFQFNSHSQLVSTLLAGHHLTVVFQDAVCFLILFKWLRLTFRHNIVQYLIHELV